MKRVSAVVFGVVLAVVLMGSFAFAQQDAKGCKDHPLFTRMPGTYIYDCKSTEFDAAGSGMIRIRRGKRR